MRTKNFRRALTALILVVLLVSVSGAVPVGGQTPFLFVDADNCPGPGSGTLRDPFCTIQDALDAAFPGALISVAEGRYAECLDMPTEYLSMVVGDPTEDLEAFEVPEGSEEPMINENVAWRVAGNERLDACDNRPGLKKIYVWVTDVNGDPLRGVKVRFDTEPSEGIAYDHMDIWGLTNEQGYVEWDHLGVPTRYRLWMEDDDEPLVENIRTDLGYEYCYIGGVATSWRPVNRPGIYSYRIDIQRKGDGD